MLVIMDMEWIEWYQTVCPTQIAALRVTPDWREESRLNKIICPDSAGMFQPNHMAFSGYSKSEFLNGTDAPSALVMLSSWLKPDDVLCWWSTPTAETFATVWKNRLHENVPFQIRLIAPALKSNLYKTGLPRHDSAYGMAAAAGIPITETEHCSADDVNVIRKLLSRLNADPEKILRKALPAASEDGRMDGSNQNPELPLKYTLDLTHKRAHLSSCRLIPSGSRIKRMGTMEGVIRTLFLPCSCCSREYWDFSGKRAEENIRKMQLNFIYAEKSRIFHKASCMHVKRIPFPQIHGSVRYETAVRHGYRPCGWCRPAPEDEKEPQHIRREIAVSLPEKTEKAAKGGPINKNPSIYNRNLSRFEQNALKRQERAVKERASMPANLTGVENHDAFILSRADYTFWAAEGYQTFHLRNCPKLNRLSHLHGYARFAEARKYGLTPCKCCKPSKKDDIIASVPMNQRIRKDETEKQINELCDRYSFRHEAKADAYYIETPIAWWKLMADTYPLEVYHMPKGSLNYHRQHRTFLSMTDTVEYIRRHDERKNNNPFRTTLRETGRSFQQKPNQFSAARR